MSIMKRLRRVADQWKHVYDQKALILMYHRVTEVNSDPWGLCVTPEKFREQLEVLRSAFHPLPLAKLTKALETHNLPSRCVVITFDDGYGDNLHNARPLLEKYDVHATVFLVSGQIKKQKEFWWDELEGIFLQSGTLPAALHLRIDGKEHDWELGESNSLSVEDVVRYSDWRAGMKPPTSRHSTYYAVWQQMQPLEEEQKQEILDELSEWAGVDRVVRSTHRTLSQEQICALADGEIVEIGAHTVTHPVLPEFSLDVQRKEIEQSKLRLEEIVGHPVNKFAYPHGQYSQSTLTLLREAGFHCACSTASEVTKKDIDSFELPRFQVLNLDGDQFSKQLLEWFEKK